MELLSGDGDILGEVAPRYVVLSKEEKLGSPLSPCFIHALRYRIIPRNLLFPQALQKDLGLQDNRREPTEEVVSPCNIRGEPSFGQYLIRWEIGHGETEMVQS